MQIWAEVLLERQVLLTLFVAVVFPPQSFFFI